MFQRTDGVFAPNASDLNAVLIAAGTKLHRAGWEAGSAFVFLHRACVCDIGLVERKCVSKNPASPGLVVDLI
jgi:hypothetical protein